jgi:hypothetical protein
MWKPMNNSGEIPVTPQYAPTNCPQTAPVVSASSPRFTAFGTASRIVLKICCTSERGRGRWSRTMVVVVEGR